MGRIQRASAYPKASSLGCVLDMPMDDISALKLLDRSGYENHGTATGTSIASTLAVACRNFNGSSDQVAIDDAASLDIGANQDFGIHCWVKFDTALDMSSTNNKYRILSKWASNVGYQLYMRGGSANGLQVSIGDGSAERGWQPGANIATTLQNGAWHCLDLVLVRTAAKAAIYLDSVAQTVQNSSGALSTYAASDLSNAAILYVGSLGGSAYYKGGMSRLEIVKRAVGPADVKARFQAEAWEYGVKS